jgi:hypothetical protein
MTNVDICILSSIITCVSVKGKAASIGSSYDNDYAILLWHSMHIILKSKV